MSKAFCILLASNLFLFSCQKDQSDASNLDADSVFAGLLQKIETNNLSLNRGVDTEEYFYNNTRLLESVKRTYHYPDTSGNVFVSKITWEFDRDSSGRIVRIHIPRDTLTTFVEYENNRAHVKKLVDSPGHSFREFLYGTNNRIQRVDFYHLDAISPGIYKLGGYQLFQYDAEGNIIKSMSYSDDNQDGILDLVFQDYYTFDNKLNPFFPDDHALLFHFWERNSLNNIKVRIHEYMEINHHRLDTFNYNYNYNSQNRPVRSLMTGFTNIDTKYYYY